MRRYLRRKREFAIEFTEEDGQIVFHFLLGDGKTQTHRRLAADEVLPREHLAAGHYEAALAAYRAVVEQDGGGPIIAPGTAMATGLHSEDRVASESYLNNQGLALINNGRFDHGIDVLRIATDLYPESANTWDSLGYAYRKKGDRDNAIRYYRMALDIDSQFDSAVEALKELERDPADG